MRLMLSQLKNSIYYSTARSASIKSLWLGFIYRIAQLIILSYIIGYDIIFNRGYQRFDRVSSTVTTKVKGQGFVPLNQIMRKYSDSDFNDQHMFRINHLDSYRMLDTSDYVVPPNEYNSVFIMTNFIETFQSQGICPEAICKQDSDCLFLGSVTNSWNGIPTGRCISSTYLNEPKLCEIRAWCPTENEDIRINDTLIRNVFNFTIFIKNDIEFKKFKLKQRNILPNATNRYISQCNYHSLLVETDPYCPVFKLDYILSKIEPNPKEKFYMLLRGGLILIEIIWNCDLDFGKTCLPVYKFKRFDTKETNTATGFNFRHTYKFKMSDGLEYRVLVKAYGLRFIINVSGTAGKFNIIPLLTTIGAGIGIMSISSYITDWIMLNFSKRKQIYKHIVKLDEDVVKDKIQNDSVYDLDDFEEIILSKKNSENNDLYYGLKVRF